MSLNLERAEQPQKTFFEVKQLFAQGMKLAIDLQLQVHDICMISGVSGSGKSQFLKALADLIEHSGEVSLRDESQSSMPAPQWRQQVMFFSAETAWWSDLVKEHFEHLPSAEELKKIDLPHNILQLNSDTLSSGEKQRLALLRGLQYQPKILLLDEITANLDPASEQLVEALVKQYIEQQAAAAIWISHDPHQAERLQTQSLVFKAETSA